MRQRRIRTLAAPATIAVGALALTSCGTGIGGDELSAEDVQRVLVGDVDSSLALTDRAPGDDHLLGANCEENGDGGFTCELLNHMWMGEEDATPPNWASVEGVDVQTEQDGDTAQMTLSPIEGTLSALGGIIELDPAEEGGTVLFSSLDDQQIVEVESEALETEDDATEREPVSTEELEQYYLRDREERGYSGGQASCETDLEPTVGSFVYCVSTTEDFNPEETATSLPFMVYQGASGEDGYSLRNAASTYSPAEISEADELPEELIESDEPYEDVDVEPEDD